MPLQYARNFTLDYLEGGYTLITISDGSRFLTIPEGMESEGAPYGFAIMNAENQELLDMFNAGLKNIKENGKYDEIIAKYLEK